MCPTRLWCLFALFFYTARSVDPWGGNSAVLNEDLWSLLYNAETTGGFVTPTFDTLTIPLNLPYDSACIEWFVRLTRVYGDNTMGFIPRQNVMFYGSDVNNYVFVSAGDGNTGSITTAPASLYQIKSATGGAAQSGSFTSFDAIYAWTHFAICLQPASKGPSFVYGLGDFLAGGAVNFWTNSTFSKIAGTTNLIIGQLPSAVTAALGGPLAFGGRIGEIRIWNKMLTVADLTASRYAAYQPNTPNLVHRYGFEEGATNAQTVADAVGGVNGQLTGPGYQLSWGGAGFNPPSDMIPRVNFIRQVAFNGSFDIRLATNYGNIQNMAFSGLVGRVCAIVPNVTCTPLNSTAFPANLNKYSIRYMPDRAACGNNITFSGVANLLGNTPPQTNPVNFNVNVGSIPLPATFTVTPPPVPTLGGLLQIPGLNLGLDGVLGPNEKVTVTFPGQPTPLTCAGGYVTGNVLNCMLPKGTGGNGTLSITICGVTYVKPNFFAYQLPIIGNLPIPNTFQLLTFTGSNFGIPRTFDNKNDLVQIVNAGVNYVCNVTAVNDSAITCFSPFPLINGNTYTVIITITGQTNQTQFIFQKCNPPCQNGGICQQDATCNCFTTGFKGAICTEPLVCSPPCANGKCVLLSNGSQNTTCSCFAGFAPPYCADAVGNGTPVGTIVGVVVGGSVGLLGLAAIIVFIVVRRGERREGANFLPLEKKDFTKIIYGDQLNQIPERTADLQALENLLIDDDGLSVAFAISAITQITEADKIAKALVVVFQDNNKIIKLLEAFITQEVQTTESAGTLFRANSMVSKMFKFYSRLIGLPYLYVTIGPELGKLVEEELGLEVDPEKMEEGKDLDEMRWALMSQSQKILKQIIISDDKCPSQFRTLFAHIAKQVTERFPENVNTTIGGFIFLRLFCPAVSSPEAYGIVEEPPNADSRRLLILITKVLQNLSNDVEFGSKEPYMTKMNDFIQSNRPKLVVFYETLLKGSTKPPVPCEMPKNIKPLNLAILAQHIRDNIDKIDDPKIKAKLQAALPHE